MSASLMGHVPGPRAGYGGGLVDAYVNQFETVRPFFRRDPRSDEDWSTLFGELEKQSYPRAEMAEVLAKAVSEYRGADAAYQNAQAMAEPNVYAVITGQQAGLFGGPLYTLHKALTAIRLAEELNKKYGPDKKFVPLFWVASDDHDLAEIDHAYFFDAEGQVQRVQAAIGEEAEGVAAVDVTVKASIEELYEPVEFLLPGAAQGLLAPYRKRNLGSACARLLTKWLSGLGLVVFESYDVRAFGRGLFARELDDYAATCALIRDAGGRMKDAGFEPGLAEARDAPHLFVSAQTLRAALEPEQGGALFRERSPAFASRGLEPDTYMKEVLKFSIESTPQQFSPSAALRPVLQNSALPVAAAVLGPGEMAYWAQLAPLHDHYGAAWPMIVPRASFTLLDEAGAKAVRKLNAQPDDLFLDEQAMQTRLFGGGELDKDLSARAEKLLAEYDGLAQRVREGDGGLESMLTKSRKRFEHELGRIRRRANLNHAEREGAGLQRLKRLQALVRPRNRPQERTLCIAQFLALRPELAADLLPLVDPFVFEHRIVAI